MRVYRRIPVLIAAATMVGGPASNAYGFEARAPQGPSEIPAATPIPHDTGDTTGWLIGAGAAGVLVVGGGIAVSRRGTSAMEGSAQRSTHEAARTH